MQDFYCLFFYVTASLFRKAIFPLFNKVVLFLLVYSFCPCFDSGFIENGFVLPLTCSSLILGILLSIAFIYAFRVHLGSFPTSVFIISFPVNFLLLFLSHDYIFRLGGKYIRNIVIIGNDNPYRLPDRPRQQVFHIKPTEIEKLIYLPSPDEIIITEEVQNVNLLIYLLNQLKTVTVFSPTLYSRLLPDKINGANSVYQLSTFLGRKSDATEFLIRLLDIVCSVVLLIAMSPLLVLVIILVKLTSPGTIFYSQTRVAKDGEFFSLYKFRTMINDAEAITGPTLAINNDSRITPVGSCMRKTRIDEIPQLWNVLRGEMSLVGPRPERPFFVKQHKALRGIRLAIKPGITGLAQIRGLYDLKPQHKLKYDYLYIQKRSVLLNVYILFQTIPIILKKNGV
jgi:lipopolysaccharide/colanic/teichoic acid biosynthesis glycosyltransferase